MTPEIMTSPPIKGHLYLFTVDYGKPCNGTANWQYILIFLNKDSYRKHFGIIASNNEINNEINNDTLDIYDSFVDYTLKEISVKDLPIYIDWNKTRLFTRLLKGEQTGTTPKILNQQNWSFTEYH